MRDVLGLRKRRNAQTLVFFLLAWGTIMLLCGLAIDSGLLYLAKARMGRAVDGAALAAVGNFNRNEATPALNRDAVATIMRNFAVANFTDLSPIGTVGGPSGGTAISTTEPNGTTSVSYTYSFNDSTQDPNGAFRRFVDVTLNTGSGGAITGATCNARCPVQTYFIGYASYAINGHQNGKIGGYSGVSGLMDLKVSSSAVATRNPRLIMVVLDRSASMLGTGGGATGLAPAVVQFLDFFDTSSDTIGIVSFGSSARLEMPMTTNFIIAGTNVLIDGYETNSTTPGINAPGIDKELDHTRGEYQTYYNTTGIRRLKFGGQTAAEDGIRLGLEQMMANSGFTDPDVVKYMVIFTDGKWNATRTLIGAPGYTNVIQCPPYTNTVQLTTNAWVTNLTYVTTNTSIAVTNGAPSPWVADATDPADQNVLPVPSMGSNTLRSSLPLYTNAVQTPDQAVTPGVYNDFTPLVNQHTNDVWQSADSSGYEPLGHPDVMLNVGTTMSVTNTTWMGQSGGKNVYTKNLDVWLQPGAAAYLYTNYTAATPVQIFPSDFTNPTKHIVINLVPGNRLELVVPGYITDGLLFDGIDLAYSYPEAVPPQTPAYPRYRGNNYQEGYMWPDDTTVPNNPIYHQPYVSTSIMRELMFRNYPNLLTGYIVYRADDPVAPYIPSRPVGQQGIEPLITDQTNSAGAVGAPRPLYGLGAYYPGAGFYWPFGGDVDTVGNSTTPAGFVTNAVGVDYDPTYALPNPLSDPDPQDSSDYNGGSRHDAYSINMLSTNAAPEWYGELFYKGSGGTNSFSGTGTSSVSTLMQTADWKVGLPAWASVYNRSDIMMDDPNHDPNIVGTPSTWHPLTYNGSNDVTSLSAIQSSPTESATGGYVSDGNGHYYYNTMAWSGRPTHYYDFSLGSWEPITDNHNTNQHMLQLGNWKAGEYCWHARALGVTIYTVGYGTQVTSTQCALLAQLANATNQISPGSPFVTNHISTYNPNQPIGQQFYATTAAQISNDFFSIGQAINAALTQ
jgi:Flp pilus assembly protein TadG